MKYEGISEPYKISRVYERDIKSKKTKIMQMMRIKSISAGTNHAAMVDEIGKVFTWGAGSYGRTGLGDTMDSHSPIWIKSLDHPRYGSCFKGLFILQVQFLSQKLGPILYPFFEILSHQKQHKKHKYIIMKM